MSDKSKPNIPRMSSDSDGNIIITVNEGVLTISNTSRALFLKKIKSVMAMANLVDPTNRADDEDQDK